MHARILHTEFFVESTTMATVITHAKPYDIHPPTLIHISQIFQMHCLLCFTNLGDCSHALSSHVAFQCDYVRDKHTVNLVADGPSLGTIFFIYQAYHGVPGYSYLSEAGS